MKIYEQKSFQEARDQLKESQAALNALVSIYEEKEPSKSEGKLAGVPVVLKDNINTKGHLTTASSKILENYVPVYDATIVNKL